jgi:hypothetical protein
MLTPALRKSPTVSLPKKEGDKTREAQQAREGGFGQVAANKFVMRISVTP